MKHSLKSILAVAMLLTTSLAFTSCEGALDDLFGEWDKPGSVTSISLHKTTLTLVVGEADVTLNFTLKPDNAIDKTATWSSDNTAVATVDEKGTVHAVAEGTATITVQAGKKTASCVVTVITIPVVYETYKAWDGTALTAQKVSTLGIREVTDATTSFEGGFYIVKNDVTIPNDIYISEDTKLILCDGATLTINGFIEDPSTTATYSLTIFGQENQTGKLIVNATTGHNGILVKDLEIHGGDISITGNTQKKGILAEGNVTIYGGKVTATGGDNGDYAAIQVGNKMEVYGGTINATGRHNGQGILVNGTGTSFVVSGGTITAQGGNASTGAAGIAVLGASHITGGTINTTGGDSSADFGGAGIVSDISVDGGSVIATGGAGTNVGQGVLGKITYTVTTARGTNDNSTWPGSNNLTSGHKYDGTESPYQLYRYIKLQY